MSEPNELQEPQVTDVPEPDQEPHEPIPDEADQQAEEEATEAEEPAGEPAEAPEEQGASQAEWEARFTKSEKRFATYTRQISDIYGDDATDLIPVSISPSAPPGFIYVHDAGRVPEDVKAPILEFFGIAREQDYEPDPETETCRVCKGKTKTKTGSHAAEFQTRTCPRCKGWGYTIQGRAPSDAQTLTNGAVQDAPAQVGPLVTDENDAWGEPRVLPDGRLNPNYGKMPQFKELIEPWGVTANLTAQDTVA